MRNKRRSRDADGELVHKRHFVHPKITADEVFRVAEETVVPFCLENGIKMVIGDNDSKLHSKGLEDLFEDHAIELYNGSGKTVGSHENGYPPRSHDCQPAETHFANVFHEAQVKLEDAEKKRSRPRSMMMWKYALDSTWNNWPLEEIQKLIDRQPEIMEKIVELGGERTAF